MTSPEFWHFLARGNSTLAQSRQVVRHNVEAHHNLLLIARAVMA